MEPKSKDQLIQELRERVYALEEIESDRDAIERELKSTRQRLQHLLAVSPAIIYTTKASGDFACTYVQRESPGDHGLYAGADDNRSQVLARPPPS